MLPHTHFLAGFVFGLIGIKLGLFGFYTALLIGIFAVLIDIDHLINYYLHKGKPDFKATWNTAVRDKKAGYLWSFVHHWPMFFISLLFLGILSQFNFKLFYLLSAIYIPHFLLDHLAVFVDYRIEKHKYKKIGSLLIQISYLEFFFDFIFLILLIYLI